MPLHPQAELLINLSKQVGLPELQTMDPEEARLIYDQRAAALDAEPKVGSVTDRVIPGPGGDLPIRHLPLVNLGTPGDTVCG